LQDRRYSRFPADERGVQLLTENCILPSNAHADVEYERQAWAISLRHRWRQVGRDRLALGKLFRHRPM
jgi:hypothetical protein